MNKLLLSLLVTYPQPQAETGGAGPKARGSCLVAAEKAPAHRLGLQVCIPERSWWAMDPRGLGRLLQGHPDCTGKAACRSQSDEERLLRCGFQWTSLTSLFDREVNRPEVMGKDLLNQANIYIYSPPITEVCYSMSNEIIQPGGMIRITK